MGISYCARRQVFHLAGGNVSYILGLWEGRYPLTPVSYTHLDVYKRQSLYLGEGRFTGEPIEAGYFGCGGVAQIPGLQKKLLTIGRAGFRHHCVAARGHVCLLYTSSFSGWMETPKNFSASWMPDPRACSTVPPPAPWERAASITSSVKPRLTMVTMSS